MFLSHFILPLLFVTLGGSFVKVLHEEINGRTSTIPQGIITHINIECPPEGLTINACATNGTVILYISKSPNPSSATYDNRIEIEEGDCDNTFIKCSTDNEDGRHKRQSAVSEETIHIAIEGVGEDNEYTLNATTGDFSTPKGTHLSITVCQCHYVIVLIQSHTHEARAMHYNSLLLYTCSEPALPEKCEGQSPNCGGQLYL